MLNFINFPSRDNQSCILFQLCSSAPIKTVDIKVTNSGLMKKLGEISEKVKAIQGVNSKWMDEFIEVINTYDTDNLFRVHIENEVCTKIELSNLYLRN